MTTKLTLSIEKNIIENAKIYAEKHSKSLSRLIQDYLESISKKDGDEISPSLPPITKKPATKTVAKPTTKVTTKKAAIQKKKTPSKKSIATKKK